jgi:hypothetical protein
LMGEDSDQGNDGSDSRWPPLLPLKAWGKYFSVLCYLISCAVNCFFLYS